MEKSLLPGKLAIYASSCLYTLNECIIVKNVWNSFIAINSDESKVRIAIINYNFLVTPDVSNHAIFKSST